MELPVRNLEGEVVGEITVRDDVFGVPVNVPLMHQAVVMYLANRRQGTHDTKTRGEVSGGGRKPWVQKGTGRARQGSIRAPHWRHGGIVHGPHPRDYRQEMPKKMRRLALKSALSAKIRDGELIVVEDLALPEGRTREFARVLRGLGLERSVTVVLPEPDRAVILAAQNLPDVWTAQADNLNAYDVLARRFLLLPVAAVRRLEARLADREED